MNTPDRTTRRSFIKAAAAAGACAGSLAVPRMAKSAAPNDEINVGLIGVGIRGYALHDGINQSEHARLGGISDISDHYIDRIKPRLKDPKTPIHRDYRALLDDRHIDAVVIASPDHWHAQMTLDAMDAGKDVYVEKPMTYSFDEAVRVRNAARKSGRVTQVGYQRRTLAHFYKAREIVQSGILGEYHPDSTLVVAESAHGPLARLRHLQHTGAAREVGARARRLGAIPGEPASASLRPAAILPLAVLRGIQHRDLRHLDEPPVGRGQPGDGAGNTGNLLGNRRHLPVRRRPHGPRHVQRSVQLSFPESHDLVCRLQQQCVSSTGKLNTEEPTGRWSWGPTGCVSTPNRRTPCSSQYVASDKADEFEDLRAQPIHKEPTNYRWSTTEHLDDFFENVKSRGQCKAPVQECFKATVALTMAIQSYKTKRTARWDADQEQIVT